MKLTLNKKWKYGSLSVVLTALVIAAVVIFNVIFTALANKFLWVVDMTAEGLYTVSQKCYNLLSAEFDSLEVSRAESDENNASLNQTAHTANEKTIAANGAAVSSIGNATLTLLWSEAADQVKAIQNNYAALAGKTSQGDRNSLIDAMNKSVTKVNKKIDSANATIQSLNNDIKAKNARLGLSEGDAGYAAPLSLLSSLTSYTRVNGDLKVKIIFCDDPDVLESNTSQRYVHDTALQLQKKFSDIIEIEYIDIWKNPSAVDKYRVSSYDYIYSTDVIIASGTESRVYNLKAFYVFDSSDDTDPWAYNGEKKLTAGILSVTRAESPIACLTYNHNESTSYEMYYALEDAGYEVQLIDLLNEEIPEDCRLLLTCNPTQDFFAYDATDPDATKYKQSEIDKLDKFLDGCNSYILFVSPETPVLHNLEEYMDEWGVVVSRDVDPETEAAYNYRISDITQSLTSDGYTIFGQYASTTSGLGYALTEDMQASNNKPAIIFKNATALQMSDSYTLIHDEDNDTIETSEQDYGVWSIDSVSRKMYRVFNSTANSVAYANGEEVARATEKEPFALMTITQEIRHVNDSNYTTITDPSNFVVFSSTDFYAQKYLQNTTYGNSEVLASVFAYCSREVVAVDLTLKPFATTEISTLTTKQMTAWTVCLAVIPAALVFGAGIFVIVRRKYA